MLPRMLKNMNLTVDGISYIGEIESVTPPKLSRKTEAFRSGGMAGAAHLDMGLDDDALKAEWSIGGYSQEVMKQIGIAKIDGVALRFTGALQRDDTGEVSSIEIIMRGRHQEVDRGEFKAGDKSSTKVSTHCIYYRETVDGVVVQEVDVLNMVHVVNGVDVLKEHRNALGI